jgi:uncharacterized spore protein YtfJ
MTDEIVAQAKSANENPFDMTPSLNVVSSTLDKLMDTAKVDVVFAAPIQNGEMVVVPSAEVLTVVGFGVGSGGGKDGEANVGGGGGGGGGGRSFARPVAAIVVTPNRVRIEPIVDVTKIALAAVTAFGFMLAMVARMNAQRAPRFDEE